MERATFSLLFYIRRTKLNRHGEAPILIRITVNGVRADASIKKTILPQLWDADKGRALDKKREGKELNLYLDAIYMRILKIQRDLEIEGANVTASKVLDRWDTYRKKFFFLSEMSQQFVEDYMFWLLTKKGCSHNTSTKYLKNFKKIILLSLAKGWLKKDPFAEYKFTLEAVDRDFLEDSEIQKILSKEIAISRLVQVRDTFIFCCFTGLAFSDVKQLKQEDIVEDSNGVKWIRKERQKTKIICNIPLRDITLQILKKYENNPQCVIKGVLLPILCNQKMNAYLKELGDICGINKTITTHTARHTFATYALANGVSMESVAKMLGHTNLQMTRHYARTLDRTVVKELFQIKDNFVMTN